MAELTDWLDRLRRMDDEDPRTVETHSVFYRVASTSRMQFDDSIIRVDDTGVDVTIFGNQPTPMSVVHFMDAGGHNLYRDQAIGTQLGALLTFALRRKVRVASSEVPLRMEGSTTTTFLPATILDRELLGPTEQDPKLALEQLLQAVHGLSENDREPVLAAIELHYAATQLYDVDLATAHTLLVAGIETLAGHFEPLESTWPEFIDADHWDQIFVDLGLNYEQAERLRRELLAGKHFKLRQRFVSYSLARLDSDFWDTAIQDFTPSLTMTAEGANFTGMTPSRRIPIENFVPRDEGVLRRRLLATYDARSKFVHAGSRSITPDAVLSAAVGLESKRTEPLEFSGIRRVLEYLIQAEIDAHSTPTDMPSLRLRRLDQSEEDGSRI